MTAALLKGRGNYICHYHLDRMQGDERALKSRSEIAQLRQIQVFAGISKTGDRGDLAQIPEDAEIWQRVTSTRENCLGQECPRIRDCFVVKARRQAQDADVVVVNHALFMADLVLREEGVTDLLPEADTVIFDEAHQLPDTATRFLGSSVSTHQLLDFGRALEAAGLAAREAARWSDVSRHLETARELRLVCAPLDKLPGRKATFEAMPEAEEFDQALAVLREAVDTATNALGAVAEKHPDLMAAARNGAEISARLKRWATPARAGSQDEDGWGRDDQSAETAAGDGLSTPVALLEGAAAAMQWTGPAVRWVEHGLHHASAFRAPVGGAGLLEIPQARPGLDHDLGHAVGEWRVRALHRPAWPGQGAHGQMGVAVRLSRAGAPVRAARHARAAVAAVPGPFRADAAALAGSQSGRHAGAVHDAARGGQSGQPAGRRLDDAGHEWPLLSRATPRAATCSNASASCRIRCWWAAPASGKASTCPATC